MVSDSQSFMPPSSPPPMKERGFARLPTELLPLILNNLAAPSHLHAAALVCSAWTSYAQEALYRHVWVRPWQSAADWKLVCLLETLSSNCALARHVRRLEIRSYPPPQVITGALSSSTLLSFLGLRNLTSLAFTRDHSLSPQLLSAVASSMPRLRELEINAHSSGSFDPRCLVQITGRLERLVLIMPDRGTCDVLADWLERIAEDGLRAGRTHPGLRELSILSKFSPLVNDALLQSLAPALPHLRTLILTACSRVTSVGILALLKSAAGSSRTVTSRLDGLRTTERGVVRLGLESLDRLVLEGLQPSLATLTPNLRWISLTPGMSQPARVMDARLGPEWLFGTLLAPFARSLEAVHVTRHPSTSLFRDLALDLPTSGLPSLETLSIPPLGSASFPDDLPALTPRLRHLFIALEQPAFAFLARSVSQWSHLATIHFVLSHEANLGGTGWEPTMQDLGALAASCRSLRQVGSRTRVYDVRRSPARSFSPRTEGQQDIVLERFDMEAGGRVPDVYQLGRFLG